MVACFAAFGPLLGGFLADYFANRSFACNMQWNGPHSTFVLHLFQLHDLTYLFIIEAALAFLSLRILYLIKEEGEVDKEIALTHIKVDLKNRFQSQLKKEFIVCVIYASVSYTLIMYKKFITAFQYSLSKVIKATKFSLLNSDKDL